MLMVKTSSSQVKQKEIEIKNHTIQYHEIKIMRGWWKFIVFDRLVTCD